MNHMKTVRLEKVTLNIGVGKETAKLDKGMKLLKNITGISPVKTFAKKRIPAWGLRPGLPIGCKITLRKGKSREMLHRLLDAKSSTLKFSQFDNAGNLAFGIHEYIDIKDAKYDPEIGMMGLEVCVTLERPGFRIKKRKRAKTKVPRKHQITKEDAVEFMKKEFNIRIEEEKR